MGASDYDSGMTRALPELDAMDQRILGALMEKQRTVPATYPLSMNSLRLACNQTTSRDPVTSYNEVELEQRLQDLKKRELVRIVWAGRGARTLKYHQRLEELLELDEPSLALLAVLLLRGAQSPGELKTRTDRLHKFADRDEVTRQLTALASADPPLVAEQERRPGQQDNRWIHLLGPTSTTEEPQPKVDREGVLSEGVWARDAAAIAAYDEAAAAYADASSTAWEASDFDHWLLWRIEQWSRGWPIADIGCGPGHTTAYLTDAGAEVVGSDASPGMVEQARARYPELTFEVTTFSQFMRPKTAAGWGAVIGWSCLGHLAASEIRPLISQLAATLRLGGVLALKVEVGKESRPATNWFDIELPIPQVLHDPGLLVDAALSAGLTIAEHYQVGPAESGAERFYLIARRES